MRQDVNTCVEKDSQDGHGSEGSPNNLKTKENGPESLEEDNVDILVFERRDVGGFSPRGNENLASCPNELTSKDYQPGDSKEGTGRSNKSRILIGYFRSCGKVQSKGYSLADTQREYDVDKKGREVGQVESVDAVDLFLGLFFTHDYGTAFLLSGCL